MDGGEGERIVRSRLVAMEIAWDTRTDTFAGTPPLKAVRLALALGVSLGREFLACLFLPIAGTVTAIIVITMKGYMPDLLS